MRRSNIQIFRWNISKIKLHYQIIDAESSLFSSIYNCFDRNPNKWDYIETNIITISELINLTHKILYQNYYKEFNIHLTKQEKTNIIRMLYTFKYRSDYTFDSSLEAHILEIYEKINYEIREDKLKKLLK